VLVATPGRLLDLVQQKHVRLDAVSILVIDEADRMFDMGFIRDVRRLVSFLPKQRHSMLFSATMPKEVSHLVAEILHDPIRIDISPAKIAADKIDQRVYHVAAQEKRTLLRDLLRDAAMARVIVFTRTKHGANKVAETLSRQGVSADAIHGNKSQNARQRALDGFRAGQVRVLVATDIAARGIDVDGISHVVNFELPNVAESYVHRIGRTARAGAGGVAIAFCDPSERPLLKDIERLVREPLTVVGTPPLPVAATAAQEQPKRVIDYAKRRPRNRRFRGNRSQKAA
jgi:ATP-dependent RNA helicase RhlE